VKDHINMRLPAFRVYKEMIDFFTSKWDISD